MTLGGPLQFGHADGDHLQHTALDLAGEIGVGLDAVHYHHAIGLPGIPIHKDGKTLRRLAQKHGLHRGADLRAHGRFVHAVVREDLALPRGGSSPMASHSGEDKRPRP